jgi:NADPH-dependent 2,4-dienoyl-CoA reductase/sulfur reductase-like enzyme
MSDGAERDAPAGSRPKPDLSQAPGRRNFLTGAAAVGAAGTAGMLSRSSAASASGRVYTRTADVLVVGAGLSGLAAAWEIVKAGRSVIVLEARDRIGGRMVRRPVIEGGWVDLGGQWVGPTQTQIIALATPISPLITGIAPLIRST